VTPIPVDRNGPTRRARHQAGPDRSTKAGDGIAPWRDHMIGPPGNPVAFAADGRPRMGDALAGQWTGRKTE
jgi:hypothetical protein